MIETIHWHTLHPRYLNSESRVLDIGANIGQFSRAMIDRFGCRCVAVEPAPHIFRSIPEHPKITRIQAAISHRSGRMLLHVSAQPDASSLLPSPHGHVSTIEVEALSLHDLISRLSWPSVDLLKIDVEGAEISMLESCPESVLRKVAQMTIEFHDFCGITDPKVVAKTIARLNDIGFYSVRMSRYGHQDTWLINRNVVPISLSELVFSKAYIRNWRGLRRATKRYFNHGSTDNKA